jgi:signal transduction histidine kinase
MASDPVQLDNLVHEIHQQAAVLGQDNQVTTVLDTIEPTQIIGDELRLRELLLNIVDNAIKYSRTMGTVELKLIKDGNVAKLSVTDHGIGISSDEQTHIFDRFFRTDSARTHAQKGTGLGLAICKWIAEAHQGGIQVDSLLGKGSSFTISLPLPSQYP